MSVFSPLTSRRFSNRKVKPTQQIIVFRLRNEGFALPIRASLKVIPLGEVFGAPQATGVGLTLYQEQELLVIDIGKRIFRSVVTTKTLSGNDLSKTLSGNDLDKSSSSSDLSKTLSGNDLDKSSSSNDLSKSLSGNDLDKSLPSLGTIEGSYLLIVQSSTRKLIGLPLLEPPFLQRVPESAFAPLTSDYLAYGTIQCVSALIIQGNEQPPLFLLNPDQLVQPQSALPPTRDEY
ncbi:MAG: chemotaxis protein CheW [Coleofasciculaceae cyanobacterium]